MRAMGSSQRWRERPAGSSAAASRMLRRSLPRQQRGCVREWLSGRLARVGSSFLVSVAFLGLFSGVSTFAASPGQAVRASTEGVSSGLSRASGTSATWHGTKSVAGPMVVASTPHGRSALCDAPAFVRFGALALAVSYACGRGQRGSRRCSSTTRLRAGLQENLALVFIKPHACTPATLKAVPDFLKEQGVRVLREGSVSADEIEKQGIIDSHYASIARVGMVRDMAALGLTASAAERFQAGYGVSLDEVMAAGQLHSAATGLEVLQVSPNELLDRCLAAGYEKLGPGLYAAKLDGPEGKPIYVLNGFYARMREKFVAPGIVVNWFVVSFQEEELPWATFRGKVIGSTNPTDAVGGSLRAKIRDEWQALGLQAETNYQDNGVHASASPLEALRERKIWLGDDPEADPFGAALVARGLDKELLMQLLENPQIDFGDGRCGSAFDLLEDVDTKEVIDLLVAHGSSASGEA